MSKYTAIVYAELTRRDFALSIVSLSRICGLNYTVIGQALASLNRRGLIHSQKHQGRMVYRNRQLSFWGAK